MSNRLKLLLHSAGVWFNAALLVAFPFADKIVVAVSENLPALAPYVPANVYRWVGLAVVVFNIIRASRNAANKPKEVN